MKVLGINGSARRDGNTSVLINTVFAELENAGIETELIQLSGNVIEPRKACLACGGQANCVHQKDIFREIFDKMVHADGIILSAFVFGFEEYAAAIQTRQISIFLWDLNNCKLKRNVPLIAGRSFCFIAFIPT